jgi:hypothetical protein
MNDKQDIMTKEKILKLYISDLGNLVADSDAKRSRLLDLEDELNALLIDGESSCPFEAYAVFCIECDRQGMKPIKYKDYLEMG